MLKFNQLTYSKNLSNSKNFIENPKNIYEKNIKSDQTKSIGNR